jgi:hypothetical protein
MPFSILLNLQIKLFDLVGHRVLEIADLEKVALFRLITFVYLILQ